MLKKLIIMRHGEAESPRHGRDDHKRVLTAQGREAAAAVGRKLRDDHHWPSLVLVSDAQRTLQTLRATEKGAQKSVAQHQECPAFYHASPADVWSEVARVSAQASSLLILGHNPTWSLLIEELARQPCRLCPADCYVFVKAAADWSAAIYDGRPWQLAAHYEAVYLPPA